MKRKRTRTKKLLRPVAVTNREIMKKIVQRDEYAVGALMLLYSYQTMEEQSVKGTRFRNGEGFNGTDGGFCSSLAEQYQRRGMLTHRQMESLKRLLPKYWGQIGLLSPLKVEKPEKAESGTKEKKKDEAPEKGKTANLVGKLIEIRFDFDWDLIAQVKLLTRRKFVKERELWTAPICLETVESLKRLGFKLDKGITDWYQKQTLEIVDGVEIPGMKTKLYEFQSVGVNFIESRDGHALIGDEMGLGKTVQALGWLQLKKNDPSVFPALVVCQATLKGHWARKTLEFTELEPCIVYGKAKKTIRDFPGGSANPNVYVANYDIIHELADCPACEGKGYVEEDRSYNDPDGTRVERIIKLKCDKCKGKKKLPRLDPWFEEKGFKTVIFDECQYLRNNSAGRTVAGKSLGEIVQYAQGLSGTPILSKPSEFYNIINIINPDIFPSWWKYTARYCERVSNGFGQDVSGASNLSELHEILTRTIMLRRLKKDVLKDLPPKVRSVIPIEINQSKYKRIVEQARKELKGQEANHLTIIEKAKQAVVGLKLKSCIEWIQDYLDNEGKLVVFADHHSTIHALEDAFRGKSITVYGKTSPEDKAAAEGIFQNDPDIQLFIGSKSAKEGLTLTAAKATATLELWWTPGEHDQAEDRVHRIGQDSDSVMAYYLLAEGTIEEDITQLLDEKREILAQILDGKTVKNIDMLSSLIKGIMKGGKKED